ncbi:MULTISPECIES: hypothetical protein [unclassified Cyanobium]|uniref:hypothetical protein n=1 Tax=unclassified Cyanobium TaxID=2627006 RepID=UPI0020CDBD18|nr:MULTISPECIES: hypothetical protein [unclassified Cyanobium]MCP9777439.1 hypothetical protein [Cyanobium sp. Tous-M-B4]MCP9876601.1 hypothetical protein [Cyanobium sp. A2C-AMD]
MPEDHERISMQEQRRIHTRALSESGPPAAGETKPQEEFRLECEAVGANSEHSGSILN